MSPAAIAVTTIMGRRGPGNCDPDWQWSRPAATSGQDRTEDTDVIVSAATARRLIGQLRQPKFVRYDETNDAGRCKYR
jgi:hypothetical protein